MKNKYWIMIFGGIFALCLVLALLPALAAPASQAQIKSGDSVITVDLRTVQEFRLEAENGGYNIVTVENGKIAVTEASCPDQYCVKQGFCNSGAQIVCLPHGLVITFIGETDVDGALG